MPIILGRSQRVDTTYKVPLWPAFTHKDSQSSCARRESRRTLFSAARGIEASAALSPSAQALFMMGYSRWPSSREVCMISFTRILVRLWIRDPDFRSLVLLVFLTLLTGT